MSGDFGISGIETIDRLLHQGPAKPNAPIHLLRQNPKTLVAEEAGLSLLRVWQRWHDRKMIARVQRDCLGKGQDRLFEAVKPGIEGLIVLAQEVLDFRGVSQISFECGLDDHALSDTRTIGRGFKFLKNPLGQADSDLARRNRVHWFGRPFIPTLGIS